PMGYGLAADRAAPVVGARLLGREPHLALAVAVEVILALVGKELDRADIALAAPQRMLDGEIIELAVERRRLPSEFSRRMRVGIGGEEIAVEERHPPIHRRGGGKRRRPPNNNTLLNEGALRQCSDRAAVCRRRPTASGH